jgi:hypothetical protein
MARYVRTRIPSGTQQHAATSCVEGARAAAVCWQPDLVKVLAALHTDLTSACVLLTDRRQPETVHRDALITTLLAGSQLDGHSVRYGWFSGM